MDEQKTNYINIGGDTPNVGNIFSELSGDLGDLDFSTEWLEEKPLPSERNWLILAYKISGYVFTAVVCVAAIILVDLFIRTQEDNSLIANIPFCSYVSYGVENYPNDDCKTLSMILSEVTVAQKNLQKTLLSNLMILVPRRLQSIDVLSSPKVRFIQEHTGNLRASITGAMDRFNEVKNRTPYQGQDIECRSISANETGELSLSCDVYGWALIPLPGATTRTSRESALEFLWRLSEQQSGFQVLNAPKTLSIATYASSDGGIRSVFSTVTPLELKLKYLPANQMQ